MKELAPYLAFSFAVLVIVGAIVGVLPQIR
jgi:hypothetical protein